MESSNPLSDVYFEILSRVSLQTLGKCRLVCKQWNDITYEPSFMDLHCDRTGPVCGYFIGGTSWKKEYSSTFVGLDHELNSVSSLSLDFLPARVKIEASSNQGILFCVSQQPRSLENHTVRQYYVCKPSTKEWRLLPNPKTQDLTQGTALIVLRSNPLHYKIVRFLKPTSSAKKNTCYNLPCEIFDSKNWAWKQSKEVELPNQVLLLFNIPAVSASGSFHWLTTDNRVFAFDVEQENWSMFPLPAEPFYEMKQELLVEYKGKLASIWMDQNNTMEVWVMEDYGVTWNKRYTLSIEALRRQQPIFFLPAAFYNADIAIFKGIYRVIIYNFQNCTSSVVRLGKHIVVDEVFAFRSDFKPAKFHEGPVDADLKISSNLVGSGGTKGKGKGAMAPLDFLKINYT